MKEKQLIARDVITLVLFLISVGGTVAYAHTQFAYRDDVKEIRSMVYDLLKHNNLHTKYKKN